jgi:hypothetical protein
MSKEFLVSTADVAFRIGNALAFTGKTSLNTSLNVTMQDQEIAGGKGSKLLYKYKYGRRLALTIEQAEWSLAFLAANVGTNIFSGLKDVFVIAECVTLTNGVGTLNKEPVGVVHVEKNDGSITNVTPTGSSITVGSLNEKVHVTYQYNTDVRRVTIDADSTPLLGEMILSADKFSNGTGKTGEVQIVVPSFQVSGNFDVSLESTGATTTAISGDALSVEGETCSDGNVYAYITEIPLNTTEVSVAEISAYPSIVSIAVSGTAALSIIGIKGGMFSNVQIDPADCTFTSATTAKATVDSSGVITGVAAGTSLVTVDYNGIKDVVSVTVTA